MQFHTSKTTGISLLDKGCMLDLWTRTLCRYAPVLKHCTKDTNLQASNWHCSEFPAPEKSPQNQVSNSKEYLTSSSKKAFSKRISPCISQQTHLGKMWSIHDALGGTDLWSVSVSSSKKRFSAPSVWFSPAEVRDGIVSTNFVLCKQHSFSLH